MRILLNALVGLLAMGTLGVTYADSVTDAVTGVGERVVGSQLARMLAVETLADDEADRWSRARLEGFVDSLDRAELRRLDIELEPAGDARFHLGVGLASERPDEAGCVVPDAHGWPTYVDTPCSRVGP